MTGRARRFAVAAGNDAASGPEPLRWGVLGASSTVARHAVLPAMAASPKADVVATASLSGHVPAPGARVHDSYEAVLADPDVEAVYIPLPNHLHRPWTEKAAAAGKHVLCEKPLAPTAADAAAMAEACRDGNVLLAEAYMTPFHPRDRAVVEQARLGRLGDVRHARSGFTFPLRDGANHRWRPECGGGALLDVGIYCLAPLVEIAGRQPEQVSASARMTAAGVDASFAALLDFGDGFAAHVWCSFELPERQLLAVAGTAASVEVEQAFTAGTDETGFDVVGIDGSTVAVDTGGYDPYRGMVDHFQTVVRGGAALRRAPEDSVALLALLDRLRAAAETGTDPGPGR